MEKRLKKKAISPVIATTLLIAIVVIIALIIFLWSRAVIGDYGVKFGKNIELVCDEVVLGASYSDTTGILYVTNDGDVPVFELNLKIESAGGYKTTKLNDIVDDWPEKGLKQGGTYSGDIGEEAAGADEITLMPVLMGVSDKGGKKTYACEEQYGYAIL